LQWERKSFEKCRCFQIRNDLQEWRKTIKVASLEPIVSTPPPCDVNVRRGKKRFSCPGAAPPAIEELEGSRILWVFDADNGKTFQVGKSCTDSRTIAE
jgi:hypothetical protein